jgi:hypothetical protein
MDELVVRHDITIVVPIFNDWQSFFRLLTDIDAALQGTALDVDILVMNDRSTFDCPEFDFPSNLQTLRSIDIIHLKQNLGHQKSISVGLSWLARQGSEHLVVVMDGDGEDDPFFLNTLISTALKNQNKFVLVKRAGRRESFWYRLMYTMYKIMFRLLTGSRLEYGNFSAFHSGKLKMLSVNTDVPMHLASSICRSRDDKFFLAAFKAKRYCGKSTMSGSLITHAFAALAVFADTIAARLFVFWVVLASSAAVGIAAALFIRLFTNLAIPGWTTGAIGNLLNLMAISITLCLSSAILIISTRFTHRISPNSLLLDYFDKITNLYNRGERTLP